MFKKILIANRGEIAVRVITACRELDIIPVTIFSEPDKDNQHVKLAHEHWRLEGQPNQVYLDIPQIIAIAKQAKAEAIHPGYGFLSENAAFAQACLDAGIKFIGPKPDVIGKMGSKIEARLAMESAGVPIVPGTTEPVTDVRQVHEFGTKYGYPIAIKASAGGGGRGLKVVHNAEAVEVAFSSAQREGASYFGSNIVYLEKYLEEPRHIEVQVLGDEDGNIINLGERDCSSQRRHQKLLEETPAPNLPASLRQRLLNAATTGAKSLNYSSAGTLEFLVAGDQFYFLEVNTRVQVEHPITEMVTGIDIVKEQIKIAFGDRLSISQADVIARGHAIEFRINAEDPYKNFLPSPGAISHYSEPRLPWLRIDSACYQGYQVLPFYDSLLAKLVVWGKDRDEAIARGKVALESYKIGGVPTTIPFHLALLADERFRASKVSTKYIESEFMKHFVKLQSKPVIQSDSTDTKIKTENNGGTLDNHKDETVRTFQVDVNQKIYKIKVRELTNKHSDLNKAAQARTHTPHKATESRTSFANSTKSCAPTAEQTNEIRASMPGLIKELLVKQGDTIQKGQRLLIFEAMKMESDIVADRSGRVAAIHVKAGETIENNGLMLLLSD